MDKLIRRKDIKRIKLRQFKKLVFDIQFDVVLVVPIFEVYHPKTFTNKPGTLGHI